MTIKDINRRNVTCVPQRRQQEFHCRPQDNKAQVEEEVRNLLQQTDRLDQESEQKGHVIDSNDTHRPTK